jgi:hypothetical protein
MAVPKACATELRSPERAEPFHRACHHDDEGLLLIVDHERTGTPLANAARIGTFSKLYPLR